MLSWSKFSAHPPDQLDSSWPPIPPAAHGATAPSPPSRRSLDFMCNDQKKDNLSDTISICLCEMGWVTVCNVLGALEE